jgi:uncharacterized membrane protein YfcA
MKGPLGVRQRFGSGAAARADRRAAAVRMPRSPADRSIGSRTDGRGRIGQIRRFLVDADGALGRVLTRVPRVVVEVVLFVVAALLIGLAKTAIGGLASISVAIFASLMPTRESTAAILLLLIVGDVVAVWQYHRDADLGLLKRLIPAVIPGLALGAVFLAVVDDTVLRRSIGVLLLVLAGLQLFLQTRGADSPPIGHSRAAGFGTGLAAGFVTMTANAAGAVMTLYLVARGVEKWRFLGTSAVFFFGVNLCKVPFSAALGLFGANTVRSTVLLAPFVVLGAWAGLHLARRLSQTRFDQAVLAATALSAVALIVR